MHVFWADITSKNLKKCPITSWQEHETIYLEIVTLLKRCIWMNKNVLVSWNPFTILFSGMRFQNVKKAGKYNGPAEWGVGGAPQDFFLFSFKNMV